MGFAGFLYKLVHILEIPIFFSCLFTTRGLWAQQVELLVCLTPSSTRPKRSALLFTEQVRDMPCHMCLFPGMSHATQWFSGRRQTPRRCLGGTSSHLREETKDLGETIGCSGRILSPPQKGTTTPFLLPKHHLLSLK